MGCSSVSTDCTAVVIRATLGHSTYRGLMSFARGWSWMNSLLIRSACVIIFISWSFSLSNFDHTDEYHDIMYFCTNAIWVYFPVVSVSNLLPNSVFSGRFQCFPSRLPGKWRYISNLTTMASTHMFSVLISTNHCITRRCRMTVSLLTLRLLMSCIYIYIYIWSTYSWCF